MWYIIYGSGIDSSLRPLEWYRQIIFGGETGIVTSSRETEGGISSLGKISTEHVSSLDLLELSKIR